MPYRKTKEVKMRRNIALVVLLSGILGAIAYAAVLEFRVADLEQRVAILENPAPDVIPANPD